MHLLCICICKSTCICICICKCKCVYVHLYMHMCICICIYAYVSAYVYVYVFMHMYLHLHMHMYMYMYMYMVTFLVSFPWTTSSPTTSSTGDLCQWQIRRLWLQCLDPCLGWLFGSSRRRSNCAPQRELGEDDWLHSCREVCDEADGISKDESPGAHTG